MARPVAVDPHDGRRSPSQRRTSPSHQLRRTPGEKQRPRSYKPPGQTVNTADSARTMSGALWSPGRRPRTTDPAAYGFCEAPCPRSPRPDNGRPSTATTAAAAGRLPPCSRNEGTGIPPATVTQTGTAGTRPHPGPPTPGGWAERGNSHLVTHENAGARPIRQVWEAPDEDACRQYLFESRW